MASVAARLRQEQTWFHLKTPCQRADVVHGQAAFASKDFWAKRTVHLEHLRQVRCEWILTNGMTARHEPELSGFNLKVVADS